MLGSAPLWLWIVFHLLLLALLVLDAGVARARQSDAPASQRSAFWMTAVWIISALLFALLIGHALRPQLAEEYLAGYGIEESLSIDNLLVFLLLFRAFDLNPQQQRRALFWGVLGAIVLRAGMIAAGLALVQIFAWIPYAFGILLLLAALRLLRQRTNAQQESQPRWITFLARHLPLSARVDGSRFFVRDKDRLRGTHLLLALIVVEITDLLFAVDSIPAVLAISRHAFVVYASNIFAVVGLRSLYFVVAGMLEKLHRLHDGLAVLLLFVGAKMLLSHVLKIPIAVSLGVLAAIIALTILLSLFTQPTRRQT